MTPPIVIGLAERLGRDISSRICSIPVRDAIEAATVSGCCHVDLDQVRVLSESAADELFGVLVAKHGTGWFRERVKLVNANARHTEVIINAVGERLARAPAL